MQMDKKLHDVLKFDMDKEVKSIGQRLREILRTNLKRRGLIVAISGGIDSSVTAALCVKALGPKKVFGLLLPEQDSASLSTSRGQMLAEHLKIEYLEVNIASTLKEIGCYTWRDNAIKTVFPDYGDGWKNKIAIEGGRDGKINHFQLIVQSPNGESFTERLPLKEYLQIVAATNFKQRIRKTLEYFHADRLHFAVVATPNRLEYDQGFFVKNGDGAGDIKPIAHLYKTQVYALARHLHLPQEICEAEPTTDTYSMPQSQDEFYFALPLEKMDLALWAYNKSLPAADLATLINISESQAVFIYKDIENKRKTTAMLHWSPILLKQVSGLIPKPDVD